MNKTLTLLLLIGFLFSFFPAPALSADAAPGVLIVKLKAGEPEAVLDILTSQKEHLFDRTYRISAPNLEEAISSLQNSGSVEYAEPDSTLRIALNTNDPLYVLDKQELGKQWYLPKLQVPQAWETSIGNRQVIVAVVDTGIDGRHEDLNSGQVTAGYVNYCQAVDPANVSQCLVRVSGELLPGVNSDDNGHGTIVAGIIGATTNNGRGMAGLAWQVSLMPIKVLDADGSGNASDVAVGIRWAVDHGADIINMSIGGPGLNSQSVLSEAISYAFNNGVLIVAAAGNDAAITGGNLNFNPVSPVCLDNGQNMVVGVAALDINDQKARFSNFGSNCIDISAPGTGTFVDKQTKQGLVSTFYDPTRPGEHDLYVYAVGTSMAAPMVTGAAVLMKTVFSSLDVRALRDRLIAAVDDISSVNANTCDGRACSTDIGRGRLNVLKAVQGTVAFGEDVLVKSPQDEVFLLERGIKRSVSSFVLSQRFAGANISPATDSQLNAFPTGLPVPPTDGTLIKEPTNPTVYLVEGGMRRPMSLLAFSSRDFTFQQIVTLPAAEIVSYGLGSEADILDGVLMKTLNSPEVFALLSGQRWLMSFFVFQQKGLDKKQIAVITPEEMLRFPVNPKGALLPPLNGTLMRGHLDATVYLIEGGLRRGLNLTAFQNRGFRFADVVMLQQSEVNGYELGEAIIE